MLRKNGCRGNLAIWRLGRLPICPRVFEHTAYDLQTLTPQAADGHEEVLHVTDEHPFYVEGGGWTNADLLQAGQVLLDADGTRMFVTANDDEWHEEGVLVYNIDVEGGHTYFVADGAGEEGFVWVHNTCISINAPKGIAAQRNLANQLRMAGYDVVGEGILAKTPYGRREIDILVRSGRQLYGIEVKSGGAFRTLSQAIKDWHINNVGATLYGKTVIIKKVDGVTLRSIIEWVVP